MKPNSTSVITALLGVATLGFSALADESPKVTSGSSQNSQASRKLSSRGNYEAQLENMLGELDKIEKADDIDKALVEFCKKFSLIKFGRDADRLKISVENPLNKRLLGLISCSPKLRYLDVLGWKKGSGNTNEQLYKNLQQYSFLIEYGSIMGKPSSQSGDKPPLRESYTPIPKQQLPRGPIPGLHRPQPVVPAPEPTPPDRPDAPELPISPRAPAKVKYWVPIEIT